VGSIEAFDRASDPPDSPILPTDSLDLVIRPESNRRSGGPREVPDGTVSAHLGNPGSVFWRVGPFDPLRRRGCECQSDEGSACSM
jgi:hypothetical protein